MNFVLLNFETWILRAAVFQNLSSKTVTTGMITGIPLSLLSYGLTGISTRIIPFHRSFVGWWQSSMVLADQPSYLLPLGLALAAARHRTEMIRPSGRSRAKSPHTTAPSAVPAASLHSVPSTARSTVPAAWRQCIMAVDWSRRKQASWHGSLLPVGSPSPLLARWG